MYKLIGKPNGSRKGRCNDLATNLEDVNGPAENAIKFASPTARLRQPLHITVYGTEYKYLYKC